MNSLLFRYAGSKFRLGSRQEAPSEVDDQAGAEGVADE